MTIEELHAELTKQIAAGRGWYTAQVFVDGNRYVEVTTLTPTPSGFLVLEAT